MSIYGGRLHLPKIFSRDNAGVPAEPSGSGPDIKAKLPMIIGALLVIIVIILLIVFGPGMMKSLNPPISVYWKNNPLDLMDDATQSAEMNIVLVNTTDKISDITLEVTTESKELIVFCPYTAFTKVEPGNNRQVTCVIRRDPNERIFAGNYTLTVKTNLGEVKTTLEVRTK